MPGFKINGTGNQYPISNKTETARNHRWVIGVLGPITNRQALITARDFNLPSWDVEIQEINGTIKYKYAKNVSWKDVSITFYDTFQNSISNELEKWKNQVHNNNAGVQTHTYKMKSVMHLLDGAGDMQRTVILEGSFPKSIEYGKLSYTNSDIKVVEVTLSIDYATII